MYYISVVSVESVNQRADIKYQFYHMLRASMYMRVSMYMRASMYRRASMYMHASMSASGLGYEARISSEFRADTLGIASLRYFGYEWSFDSCGQRVFKTISVSSELSASLLNYLQDYQGVCTTGAKGGLVYITSCTLFDLLVVSVVGYLLKIIGSIYRGWSRSTWESSTRVGMEYGKYQSWSLYYDYNII